MSMYTNQFIDVQQFGCILYNSMHVFVLVRVSVTDYVYNKHFVGI